MSNEILTEVSCPRCLHPIDVREHGRHITCPACSSQFLLDGHFCPACNHYHRQEEAFCRQCGTALTRLCHKCKTVNWTGDEYCADCGAALDIFQLLHLHSSQATSDRLNRQQQEATHFKKVEAEDSARRMAALREAALEKQREYMRQRLLKEQKDRQLLILTAAVLLAFLLVAIRATIL